MGRLSGSKSPQMEMSKIAKNSSIRNVNLVTGFGTRDTYLFFERCVQPEDEHCLEERGLKPEDGRAVGETSNDLATSFVNLNHYLEIAFAEGQLLQQHQHWMRTAKRILCYLQQKAAETATLPLPTVHRWIACRV